MELAKLFAVQFKRFVGVHHWLSQVVRAIMEAASQGKSNHIKAGTYEQQGNVDGGFLDVSQVGTHVDEESVLT